jgi:hypothetical protein
MIRREFLRIKRSNNLIAGYCAADFYAIYKVPVAFVEAGGHSASIFFLKIKRIG